MLHIRVHSRFRAANDHSVQFHYGGYDGGRFGWVRVLIADDSREPDKIAAYRTIADRVETQGIDTLYFGQDEHEQTDRDPCQTRHAPGARRCRRRRSLWWTYRPYLAEARQNLASFIADLTHNFGPDAVGFRLIRTESRRRQQCGWIVATIEGYANDRTAWEAFSSIGAP